MKKAFLFAFICFSLAGQTVSQPGSIIHDGLTRTYRLHLPGGYDPVNTYPLVFNLHGAGSNAIEQEIYTLMHLVGDTAGFITVYPEGIDNLWNISSDNGIDDVGFISDLIDSLSVSYSIDSNRIFATGMSLGGFMSHRLACQLEERIAAIASVTGLLAYFPCEPSRPVPVMQIHGTADPIVPYAGVPLTINHWVAHNGCPVNPEIIEVPDTDTTDGCTVTISLYFPCDNSSQVKLYTVNGGEHTWPGAVLNIGITNHDIDASKEIWEFFRKYTLEGYTGIPDPPNQPLRLMIYPNPVSSRATIEIPQWKGEEWGFRITGPDGRTVYSREGIRKASFQFDCRHLEPGIYIPEVRSGGEAWRAKMVVR